MAKCLSPVASTRLEPHSGDLLGVRALAAEANQRQIKGKLSV